MTELKRKRVLESRRLNGYVDDLLGLGDAISQCEFNRSDSHPAPLRLVPLTNSQRTSLLSFVANSSNLVSNPDPAPESNGEEWKSELLQAATQAAHEDSDAEARCGRLIRRHESVAAAVEMLRERLKHNPPLDDAALNDRVLKRLEQEEREWEAKMQVHEQQVARLETQLAKLQQFQAHDEDFDTEESKREQQQSTESVNDQERLVLEQTNRSLRELLALRQEERRDIEAAIQSLQDMNKRHKKEDHPQAQSTGPTEEEDTRVQELKALNEEKQQLQQQIMSVEQGREQDEAPTGDLAALRASLESKRATRTTLQTEMETQKRVLAQVKVKMQRMVESQLTQAPGVALREEAVILHLLYQHSGELGLNELKQATAELLAASDRPAGASGAFVRALYSLVANGVVQIDRSYGSGLVTSLLV